MTYRNKNIWIIRNGIITIFILILSLYFIKRSSFSGELPLYSLPADHDTTFTISIIGDSWVEDKHLDTIIHNKLLAQNINNKIISSYQGSARSKSIYQNLYKDRSEPYSSKFIIESRPDYCIVIGGVNDASGQIGASFYSYHMLQIIKTLVHYRIKPVIVSLPEFGIEEIPEDMNLFEGILWRLRNKISAFLNNKGEIDNIKTYRKVLVGELESENLKDVIIIIDFDDVCKDYHKCPDLYLDRGHLSECGKEKLCQIISNKIIETMNGNKK